MAEDFPLVLVAYDLLYADGKDMTGQSYERRHAELKRIIDRGKVRVRLSDTLVMESAEALQTFFDAEVEQGHKRGGSKAALFQV